MERPRLFAKKQLTAACGGAILKCVKKGVQLVPDLTDPALLYAFFVLPPGPRMNAARQAIFMRGYYLQKGESIYVDSDHRGKLGR